MVRCWVWRLAEAGGGVRFGIGVFRLGLDVTGTLVYVLGHDERDGTGRSLGEWNGDRGG